MDFKDAICDAWFDDAEMMIDLYYMGQCLITATIPMVYVACTEDGGYSFVMDGLAGNIPPITQGRITKSGDIYSLTYGDLTYNILFVATDPA